MGLCLWQIDNILPSLSLSLQGETVWRQPAPGGKLLVSVTVQIITIAGALIPISGALSLGPTCPVYMCVCVSPCVSIIVDDEPWDCCARPLLRTKPSSRCAMHSCQTEPSLESMMPVAGRQDSPLRTYPWNRNHLHVSVKSSAQAWRAPAVGEGQAGNPALGSFDGMRWAQ